MHQRTHIFSRPRTALLAITILAGLFVAGAPHLSGQASSTGWKVVAWNNLGMHCMDADFSVFAILPPYNTIQAQVIDNNGLLLTTPSGVQLTYEGVADPSGSINTTSAGKTNFWSAVLPMFGAALPVDTGLLGHNMPGAANTPQPMIFDSTFKWFIAEGIPITPIDNAGAKQYYPMMKVTARDASGAALASTNIVLPVSDEMTCTACHASGSGPAAQPRAGWVNMTDSQRDYRFNILRLHDDKQLGTASYTSALATKGYSSSGLEATALGGKPILCAACHTSEALAGSGLAGIPPLTASMHSLHASVTDPTNGLTMDSSTNRSACYRCHPGSVTRCLRGVMGNAVASDGSLAIQCQNCHGPLSAVGSASRTGWFQEPTCQSCHTGTAVTNSGQIRYTSVFDTNGLTRTAADLTFATNDNVPAAGLDLYRFSSGHGGLQCSACHGSTHAEYPASGRNDNLQNIALQGHIGKIAECGACHATVPTTTNGGPHGMHPVGQTWVSAHESAASNRAACQACHGTDYRGTVLSRTFGPRTLSALGSKNWFQGQQVGCYTCHNGPGGSGTGATPPVASNLSASTSAGTAKSITLAATDPAGLALTYRIVSQAANGTVGLVGATATYYPATGFAGTDTFTYAAWNGSNDSNLATVTVSVGGGGGTVCTETSTATVPTTGTVGTPVAFSATATPSNCSGSVAYSWNFGDGSALSSSQSTSHTYAAAGTFQWSMTATIAGVVSSKTGSIVVSSTSTCSLSTTASAPSTGTVGSPVAFSATATPSNCSGSVAYSWNFGDGSALSSSQSPSHTYSAAGTFQWSMTATIAGVSSRKTGSIVVSTTTSTCSLSLTASAPTTGTVGTAVSFTASATPSNCSGTVAYSWNFGDGSALSSSRTPSHTYSSAGTFQWRVTASVSGVSASRSSSISIKLAPPTVSSVTALSNPFRIQINGSGYQTGVKVYIGSSTTAWSSVQRVSSSQLILGGEGLRSKFPRGTAVTIRIVNPDGQSVTTSYTRPASNN